MASYSRARLRYVFLWFFFVFFFTMCNIEIRTPPRTKYQDLNFESEDAIRNLIDKERGNHTRNIKEDLLTRGNIQEGNNSDEEIKGRRIRTMEQFCEHFKKWLSRIKKAEEPEHFQGISDVNEDHFQVYKKERLVFCTIPTGITQTGDSMDSLGGRMKRLRRKESFKSYNKILLVRHPFSRILSFYLHDSMDQQNSRLMKWMNIDTRPTFQNFLIFLMNQSLFKLDPVMWPTACYCSPCAIQYSDVIKAETWHRDAIRVHNITDYLPRNESSIQIPSDTYRLYWSSITEDLKMWIYKKYKADFEMFKYFPDSDKPTTVE